MGVHGLSRLLFLGIDYVRFKPQLFKDFLARGARAFEDFAEVATGDAELGCEGRLRPLDTYQFVQLLDELPVRHVEHIRTSANDCQGKSVTILSPVDSL
jgi:hypothetical protein